MNLSNKINLATLILALAIGAIFTPFYAFSLEEPEEKFYIAVKAFSDGFYDASLSLFKKFIESFPDNHLFYDANLYIAKCHYEKNDYPQALEILIKIDWSRGNYQKVDEVYYWLSLIYFKGKNFKDSYSYAQKIIDDYPQSQFKWKAYYLIANNNLETAKENEAKEIFERIIKQSQQKEVIENSYSRLLSFYFEKKSFSEIISLGRSYLADFPQGELKTEVYFYLAESYYAQGRWNEAILNYQKVLESKQNTGLADSTYQGLGFAYLEQKQNQQAKLNIDKIRDRQLRLFSQGIFYSKTKDFIQALEIFDNLINNHSDSVNIFEVYLQKADLLYEMGRLNDAIYAYQYIINNSNKIKSIDVINKAYYGLAWCYLKNGNFKKAIEEFKNTLEYTSNPIVKVSSQIQIADAYQEAGHYQKALDTYNSILEEYPDTIYLDYIQFQIGMSLLKNKDLEKAFLALKNLKNNFPSSRLIPQAQYYIAVGYFSQENYSEAKVLLEDFIAKFPKDNLIFRAYYLYGKCFFNENKYEEALGIFKKILKDYKDAEIEELVYIDIGNAHLNLSQFDKAKSIWHDFLNKYPNSQYHSSVSIYLGGLYEKEKRYDVAELYYQKVFQGETNDSWVDEAAFALGHLYFSLNDLTQAQSYFQKLSVKDTPLGLKGKLYLAKTLIQQGKSEEALNIYDKLIGLSIPMSTAALVEKGFLLKEMKQYSQAIEVFKTALLKGVDTVEIRFSLGLCLEKAGLEEQAIEEYFKIIYTFEQEKEDLDYQIRAYFRIAKIYEKTNKISDAKKIYEKIITLDVEEAKVAKVRLEELQKYQK